MVAMQHSPIEDLDRQLVLHHPLDGPLQRPRSIGAVIPGFEDRPPRLWRHLERNLTVGQESRQLGEPKLDDVLQLCLAERMKDHDVVHAVQKLRPKVLPQNLHYAARGVLEAVFTIGPCARK